MKNRTALSKCVGVLALAGVIVVAGADHNTLRVYEIDRTGGAQAAVDLRDVAAGDAARWIRIRGWAGVGTVRSPQDAGA